MELNPTDFIVALSALIATVAGYRQASKGRDDSKRQQEAANRLLQREQQHDENQTTIDNLRAEADRAYARLQVERAEHEAETRHLRELADSEAAKARDYRERAHDAINEATALRLIVHHEIGQEANRTEQAIAAAERRPL